GSLAIDDGRTRYCSRRTWSDSVIACGPSLPASAFAIPIAPPAIIAMIAAALLIRPPLQHAAHQRGHVARRCAEHNPRLPGCLPFGYGGAAARRALGGAPRLRGDRRPPPHRHRGSATTARTARCAP